MGCCNVWRTLPEEAERRRKTMSDDDITPGTSPRQAQPRTHVAAVSVPMIRRKTLLVEKHTQAHGLLLSHGFDSRPVADTEPGIREWLGRRRKGGLVSSCRHILLQTLETTKKQAKTSRISLASCRRGKGMVDSDVRYLLNFFRIEQRRQGQRQMASRPTTTARGLLMTTIF